HIRLLGLPKYFFPILNISNIIKWCFTLLFTFLVVDLFSQSSPSIRGIVKDSLTKSDLAFATITVYTAKDTLVVSYRLTDPEGKFRVPNLPLHVQLRAIVTYSGYAVFRFEFELNKDKPMIDFGVIYLRQDIRSLEEVLIVAERPPIIVRNDTIEFNASSFK